MKKIRKDLKKRVQSIRIFEMKEEALGLMDTDTRLGSYLYSLAHFLEDAFDLSPMVKNEKDQPKMEK